MYLSVCLQSSFNPPGMWVGASAHTYWAAGINFKCSLTHNFPTMSLRHKAEQAFLVSGNKSNPSTQDVLHI